MERSIASLLRRTLHHHDLLVPAFFCTQADAADEGLAFLHFHASSSILKSLDLVAICWQRRICLDCFALGLPCTSSFSSSFCAAVAAEPRRHEYVFVLVQKSRNQEAPSQSKVEGHDRQRCRAVARSVVKLWQTLLVRPPSSQAPIRIHFNLGDQMAAQQADVWSQVSNRGREGKRELAKLHAA